MKKLGLVGGMGPESTLLYYRGLVSGVQHRLGPEALLPLTIESIDMYRMLGLCARRDYDGLTGYLAGALDALAAAGADFAALSANTPHIVFDRLRTRSPLPLVSIIEAACEETQRRGLTRVGLLGTAFTMEGSFFREPFAARGIELVTPVAAERDWVAGKISAELEYGVVKPETLEGFVSLLGRMQEQDDIQAVILGCTELPLLFQETAPPMEVLDTMDIHIRALVEKIVS